MPDASNVADGFHHAIVMDRSTKKIWILRTGGFVGVPVALSGTTDEPSMRPSKGYLLSAAIGTALLPGIGTSIGLTLGGQIERSSGCK